MDNRTSSEIHAKLEAAITEWQNQATAAQTTLTKQIQGAKEQLDGILKEASLSGYGPEKLASALRAELRALKQSTETADSQLSKLRERVTELEATAGEREESLRDAKQRVAQLEQSTAERADAGQAARRRVTELEAAASDRDEQLEAEKRRATELERALSEQKDAAQKLEKRLSQSDRNLAASKAEVEKAQDEVRAQKAASEKAADLKAQLQAERERAIELEERLREETAKGTKSALAQQLAEAVKAREELHKEMVGLRIEMDRLRRVNAELSGVGVVPPDEVEEALGVSGQDHQGKKRQIGEILVEAGSITREQLEIALEEQRGSPAKHLGSILVEREFTTEEVVAQALASQCKLPFVRLHEKSVSPEAVELVSFRLANLHSCVPLSVTESTLVLAMVNPFDLVAIEDVERASSRNVEPVVAVASEVRSAIGRHYLST
ncbi:MAG: hypothetical protein HY706_10295 [Candidatus Hydrogenedentes bacterium]|nr:hypothetical protein [Candidatus Hydrogenedentota bacterium]